MTLPEVRQYLDFVSVCIEAGAEPSEMARHIRICMSEMYRRPYVRRAPKKAPSVTPNRSAILRADALANPDMPYREIGARNGGVDGARVSELLRVFDPKAEAEGSPRLRVMLHLLRHF
jgi:hypothetical protein